MTRKKKILSHINRNGQGLEVGPSHNPIAPKKEGFNVDIIDHFNKEQLVAKYQDHGVNVDNIEEVDFVWRGESYSELTGHSKYYDWIIASHMIEHTPDLIGFLSDCDSILKNDGVISLVVPDKRYCFDHFRPVTGLHSIIDSHINQSTNHSPGSVAEYFLNVVSKSGQIGWNESTLGGYEFVHSTNEAKKAIDTVISDNSYLDIHAWCFVPHSFRLLIKDLFDLGFIPLQEVGFYETVGCEFIIILGRQGRGMDMSRMEALEKIELEQSSILSTGKSALKKLTYACKSLLRGIFSRSFGINR